MSSCPILAQVAQHATAAIRRAPLAATASIIAVIITAAGAWLAVSAITHPNNVP